MAKELLMPKLGLTMKTGKIVKWHVSEGDKVAQGDDIYDVENEKLTNTIQAPESGTILKILLPEGGSAPVLQTIAVMGEPGEDISGVLAKAESGGDAPAEGSAPAAVAEEASAAGGKRVTVIGGGPGGYVAAIRAAQLGGEVTLIEKEHIGGTCLNVGCIPTKALLHASSFEDAAKAAAAYGVDMKVEKLEWDKVMAKKGEIVDRLVGGVKGLLKTNGVKVVNGMGKALSPSDVEVACADGSKKDIKGDKVIIAAGSIPAIPPIPGVKENKNCIDSTGALSLKKVPKSLLIIGGGVIGIELGSAFNAFGTEVTIIEALPKLLPMMDGELTAQLRSILEESGMVIKTEAKVMSVEDSPAGAKVNVQENGKDVSYDAEKVLVAVGRRTDTAYLDLDKAGIENDRGRITVNDKMETSVPGIYAIGDCLGKVMLAHVAMTQGTVAAENAMGRNSLYDGDTNVSCVYTSPEFAGVGLTEEQAKEQGIEYTTGVFPLAANGKSLIMNNGVGAIKLMFGKEYGQLIGAHILGPNATEIIEEMAVALGMEMTEGEIIGTIHGHPTVNEAVHEAAMAAQGRALHMPN